jgi:hypothetical protein
MQVLWGSNDKYFIDTGFCYFLDYPMDYGLIQYGEHLFGYGLGNRRNLEPNPATAITAFLILMSF